jgi:hypothetical protein
MSRPNHGAALLLAHRQLQFQKSKSPRGYLGLSNLG